MEGRRTTQQNKALHKWFDLVSRTLIEHGIDARIFFDTFFKEGFEVAMSPQVIKAAFKEVMRATLKKTSTTQLNKHKEIDILVEAWNKNLGEKFGKMGVEYVDFPSLEALEAQLER